ncbi:hypothetical protein AT52_00748 [Streptococcus equi subsp. zooepidemicus Sz35]|uniref:PqqD family protein n=1 Tax=Streptococcus equi TaxID=1336 RepID=UPI000499D2FC|nr:PqqD family protein [Streptococcus equi]AIA68593.1 hypothetical protein Q426_01835 [Streptococcus equi subsp. zooepidemicus CY]KIS19000.1 hypothetical protein AT52_00748 [Streptococcus equi subsp. zooepidemicus Sz35]MBR7684747.1 PqqD family protein [Streptococcus equi subsp. zooepidemicus]MBR7753749.1 PqqD family protein [Streptococcus equi subsp. zooepidemicus]MBR7776579.1 PqqD family protein [Streptococcus equi subsp. zooepidemicus]
MDEIYYYCSHLAWQIEPSTKTVFILDKRTNEMTIIEDSGRDIWLLISKESTLRDIIEKISISYECDVSEIQDEILEFFTELLEKELIYEI